MAVISTMASTQSAKAFVAALLAAISSAAVAAPDGFTTAEILTILGAIVLTFQATYWVSNASGEPDGDIDVITQASGKKTFALNLNSDPEELELKDQVVFKINK
jgi:hypothetical protein